MADIVPIQTQYKGYRFRSRLEARWAVFFDAVGADWEYEPEGYDLGEGLWYLPDFAVRKFINRNDQEPLTLWVEIKPKSDSGNRADLLLGKLISGFANKGEIGLLVFGPPNDFIGALYEFNPEMNNGVYRNITTTDCFRKFKAGIRRAQQARFEHGEAGT